MNEQDMLGFYTGIAAFPLSPHSLGGGHYGNLCERGH
jgi:hypothetical protein